MFFSLQRSQITMIFLTPWTISQEINLQNRREPYQILSQCVGKYSKKVKKCQFSRIHIQKRKMTRKLLIPCWGRKNWLIQCLHWAVSKMCKLYSAKFWSSKSQLRKRTRDTRLRLTRSSHCIAIQYWLRRKKRKYKWKENRLSLLLGLLHQHQKRKSQHQKFLKIKLKEIR